MSKSPAGLAPRARRLLPIGLKYPESKASSFPLARAASRHRPTEAWSRAPRTTLLSPRRMDDTGAADGRSAKRRSPSVPTRTIVSAPPRADDESVCSVALGLSRRRRSIVFQETANKCVTANGRGLGPDGMAVAHGRRRDRGSIVAPCSGPAARAHPLPVLRASMRNDPAGSGGGSASRGRSLVPRQSRSALHQGMDFGRDPGPPGAPDAAAREGAGRASRRGHLGRGS